MEFFYVHKSVGGLLFIIRKKITTNLLKEMIQPVTNKDIFSDLNLESPKITNNPPHDSRI